MDRYETEESGASIALALLGGVALGAVAMYLADPDQGRRRRAIVQDTARNLGSRTGDVVNSAWRDASGRFSGWQETATRLIGPRSSKPIDDHVLEARVRSKLSRIASNAGAIDVVADRGRVTLSGPVVPDERDAVLDLVQNIPGVEAVRARLDDGEQASMPQWGAPALLALAGGALLGYYGLARRGGGGGSRSGGGGSELLRHGLGWLSQNFRGMEWMKLLGGAVHGEPVVLERSIDIKASPETVFDVWSRYENFPHFMSHVVEVRDLGRRRSHWTVRGPVGTDVEWTSVLTRSDRPTMLAWESEPGAMVENSGAIRLQPLDGGTRATVRMAYRPPAGTLGKTVAMLMGSDPESQLEDDLVRMREFIERGVPASDAELPATTRGQMLH
ncbi:MAG: hypothetical protein JWP36_589 [Paucimonas sp.]|nr:hypothetical protein [Paucimonas sp.]